MVCTDLITQIVMRVLPLPPNKCHLLKDYLPDSEYTVRNSIKKKWSPGVHKYKHQVKEALRTY